MYVRRSIPLVFVWHFAKWEVISSFVWALSVYASYEYIGIKTLAIPFLPIATIGTAVAFYVGFKNHASYERLWEARKIWGGIANVSRTFTSAVLNLIRSDGDEEGVKRLRRELVYRNLAWINLLRIELREHNPWSDRDRTDMPQVMLLKKLNFPVEQECERHSVLHAFLSESERESLSGVRKMTVRLLVTQLGEFTRLKDDGKIDAFEHSSFQKIINDAFDMQGAAERINSYPFPRQYAHFSLVFVNLFNYLLPFGLIGEFDKMSHDLTWLSVPFSVLIAWIFITMEQVGDTSENPFEMGLNDIPMTTMCRNIEIDLKSLLGESDLPEPIAPVADVLV